MSESSHNMERAIRPHHPFLELGGLHIPAPIIPIVFLASSLLVRSHTRRRLLSFPFFRHSLGHLLAALHLLSYAYNCWVIFHGNRHIDSNTLPLLEYLLLVIGEAAHQKSNFWVHTSVALGWISWISPTLPVLPTPYFRAIASLALSAPISLGMSEHVSIEVTLSALSLFTRTTFWFSNTQIASNKFSALTLAGILLPILARTFYTTFMRTAWGRSWRNNLHQASQSWLCCVQPTNIGMCMRCAQVSVVAQTLLIAGCVLSRFVWSCFRWRWLFSGQESRAPACTAPSLMAGTQFFGLNALVKWMRAKEATTDMSIFMQWQLDDCLLATWWTSFLYMLLWLFSELISAVLGR
jgi:hypothetical protein